MKKKPHDYLRPKPIWKSPEKRTRTEPNNWRNLKQIWPEPANRSRPRRFEFRSLRPIFRTHNARRGTMQPALQNWRPTWSNRGRQPMKRSEERRVGKGSKVGEGQ